MLGLTVYVEPPFTFRVTGITVCAPPLPGVMVIDPVCWVVILTALAYTFRVAELLALTLLVFSETESQELPLFGVVVKLKEIGVVLAVVRLTVVDTAAPVVVLNVTEVGLAEITPPVPPHPLPGQKETETTTSVPPPEAEVGCSVIEPLQATPP